MDTLLKILTEIDDTVSWEKEEGLISGRILDSFGVISLVSELEDAFSVEIEASEITPENFDSVQAILQMIERLQEN